MPRGRPKKDPEQYFSRIASTSDVPGDKERSLLERLKKVEAERDALLGEKKVTEKQIEALAAAQRQGAMYGTQAEEVETGKTGKIKVFDKYVETGGYLENGNPRVRPVFKTEEVPTYYFKIDMAPCGDVALKINGEQYFHGAVYELDIDTLRTVKDLCYRTWAHDKSIHPGDENFYRRDAGWQVRNQAMLQRGLLK